jgi:predicted alpha/beta-fold hydrolase
MEVSTTQFRAPWWLPGGHAQTIWPSFFRKIAVEALPQSGTVPTPDGDFLAFDHYDLPEAKGLVVLCHGLEGHARRPYMLGMVAQLRQAGYAVLAWNYRSCGGPLNQTPIFYHSGATYDLQTMVEFAMNSQKQPLYLVGFSMGGNLILRWLGEQGTKLSPRIRAAVAISVPIDLAGSADQLQRGFNRVYAFNFLKSLKEKVRQKAKVYPQHFNLKRLELVGSLRDFDEYFTAPLHGFVDASDYYARASSLPVLTQIARPALLLQAQNDPFLSPSCLPNASFEQLIVEQTRFGGHVGFGWQGHRQSYAEARTLSFIASL